MLLRSKESFLIRRRSVLFLVSNDLLSANNKISELNDVVRNKGIEINNLNERVIDLENELNATKQTVQEKEQQIIKSTQQIEELTKVSDEQKNRISDIIKNMKKVKIMKKKAEFYTSLMERKQKNMHRML